MSEKVNQFTFQSKVEAVKARPEWPVILPFPQRGSSGQAGSHLSRATSGIEEVSEIEHDSSPALPLIKKLCQVLNTQRISYCHWKSNWKLSRWLNGDGDLDLLVASDAKRFVSAAVSLGFVQAGQTHSEKIPAMLHFYGWDVEAEKFVHLHVYRRLLIGHDLTANYHLPIEEMLLQSVSKVGLIPVPAPEFELIVFVLRKVLSSWTAEAILRRIIGRSTGFMKTAEELDYLEAHTDRAKVHELLKQITPGLKVSLFEYCLESLRLDSSLWNRMRVRLRLERALDSHARRHPRLDTILKSGRLSARVFRVRILGRSARKHFVDGGALIALVGGDGAGKTTAVNGIRHWLEEDFAVRTFHFGKPQRSPFTIAVISALRGRAVVKSWLKKIFPTRWKNHSQSHPGYLHLVRWVCAARDRYRVYEKARRFAEKGGIAICDRYPVPHMFLMDGPNIARNLEGTQLSWLSKALLNAENKHYRQIMQPDLMMVLRVDPEIAVRRKTNEKEQHVRSRSQEIWQTDWSEARAHLVDASQPPAAVLADLQNRIWQQIYSSALA